MSKRILVVEDQPDNRQIIRDMLSPCTHRNSEISKFSNESRFVKIFSTASISYERA